MQVYGYQYLLSMNSLEAAGLLKVQESGRAFSAIKQNLRLCNHEVDEKNPTDISYCYSGYAPLSVRLVEHVTKHNSWSGIEEVIVLLEEFKFEDTVMSLKLLFPNNKYFSYMCTCVVAK